GREVRSDRLFELQQLVGDALRRHFVRAALDLLANFAHARFVHRRQRLNGALQSGELASLIAHVHAVRGRARRSRLARGARAIDAPSRADLARADLARPVLKAIDLGGHVQLSIDSAKPVAAGSAGTLASTLRGRRKGRLRKGPWCQRADGTI